MYFHRQMKTLLAKMRCGIVGEYWEPGTCREPNRSVYTGAEDEIYSPHIREAVVKTEFDFQLRHLKNSDLLTFPIPFWFQWKGQTGNVHVTSLLQKYPCEPRLVNHVLVGHDLQGFIPGTNWWNAHRHIPTCIPLHFHSLGLKCQL